MEHLSPVSTAITAVTAACSFLSLIGSAFILLCYTVLPLDPHFRHILILNLATSDFLNSLNNTTAGFYILSHKGGLDTSPACVFNGFAGQVTVQATDCAILAITITTVHVITQRGPISTVPPGGWQLRRMALLSCAIWALPFFTGFLALGMGWYAPATGDWCWIKAKPVYLRYVLTHGWRFLFIIVEISLYIHLDIHLRRHYRIMAEVVLTDGVGPHPMQSASHGDSVFHHSPLSEAPERTVNIAQTNVSENTSQVMSSTHSPTTLSRGPTTGSLAQRKSRPTVSWSFSRITGLRGANRASGAFSADAQYQAIQRALLLNAYPLAYILLWLPGIANRLIEATGHTSQVMQFLQATTQLIGLANALTYGWNEKVAKQLRERFLRQ